MSAITPYNGHEAFMQVQAVREGLGAVEGVGRVMDMADIWAIDESVCDMSIPPPPLPSFPRQSDRVCAAGGRARGPKAIRTQCQIEKLTGRSRPSRPSTPP